MKKLQQLVKSREEIENIFGPIAEMPSYVLNQRQLNDLELLINGAFSPLEGYVDQADYYSILEQMRLSDGRLWPIPIYLDITKSDAKKFQGSSPVVLEDIEHHPIAVIQVESLWKADKPMEAQSLYHSTDESHRGVNRLLYEVNPIYVGGTVYGLSSPKYYDFQKYRYSPQSLRELFDKRQWQTVVSFQTRNPMHKAHVALTHLAMEHTKGKLLLQPTVGHHYPGDIDYRIRARCYKHILRCYPADAVLLNLIPLHMRLAGPKEALWHALIHKNYGATHFIVGRDHAGPGNSKDNQAFYEEDEAHHLLAQFSDELGIEVLGYKELVYCSKQKHFIPSPRHLENHHKTITGTKFRSLLRKGEAIPDWFSYPKVIQELRRVFPSLQQQGFAVFFTGLSGAGKSTLAKALDKHLFEFHTRKISILDGDIIRNYISNDKGFSKEDRVENIKRIGFVASEIVKHNGIAICAAIAPYHDARTLFRNQVEEYGKCIEVYVSTPLEVCEQRDSKGLYAKARQGVIQQFTGVSDTYEIPEQPDLSIDTSKQTVEAAIATIVAKLKRIGFC
jgi:sulfate adenylyltransferase